jgi:AraC-like DNA-binding protein
MEHLPTSTESLSGHLDLRGELVYQGGRQIPGSVQYTIRRYVKPANWMGEDAGVMTYQYHPATREQNFLELKFCVAGNMYCRNLPGSCSHCQGHSADRCEEKIESIDTVSFVFSPTALEQFVKGRSDHHTLTEDILSFSHTTSFSRSLFLCGRTRLVLEGLLNHNYRGSLENIYVNAQTQMLLLYTLDCMDEKQIDVISCKFLANVADREKIIKAREILLQQIGEPITIRELSRKVAMNECYLKKGFKEMFGSTIFDFYQSQRMEHAKYLLYEKGLTVTDVSVMLGYSSISHFSTAFKKHTGLISCLKIKVRFLK